MNKPTQDRADETLPDSPACLLNNRQQKKNIAIYAACFWLMYLGAPVFYVGLTQAALCDKLEASALVANLPGSAFLWMSAVPIFVASRFHTVAAIKPVLVVCCLIPAVAGLLVAAALWLPLSREI